ncbi:MAG: hypothetical protein K5851_03430 [Lachnospiraceae bacterium]|nr:hypothetical protein [Lachnospiraceae bacterium]
MTTLKAEKRDLNVKAKKLRREGLVTASIFGKNIEGALPIQMSAHDVEIAFRGIKVGSEIEVDVEGDVKKVRVKEIQKNVLKGLYLEIDFQEIA